MALEVLLYNLLVLDSALRCVLPKHKSSIQKRNHSVNDVGGHFLETLLMIVTFGFLLSLYQCVDVRHAVVTVAGEENIQSEITADFFYIHVSSHLK